MKAGEWMKLWEAVAPSTVAEEEGETDAEGSVARIPEERIEPDGERLVDTESRAFEGGEDGDGLEGEGGEAEGAELGVTALAAAPVLVGLAPAAN
jgi:hypothetical protein